MRRGHGPGAIDPPKLRHKRRFVRANRRTATDIRGRSQCLCKHTPPALAMTVEPICPRPNHEGEAAGIDIDRVAEDRSTVIERLDRNQVVPSCNQRVMFAALYFIVVVVDLLEMQRVYADRDDSEDEQLAFKDEPLAPALGERAGRHKASQRPDHMTEKRTSLNFIPCFGGRTI